MTILHRSLAPSFASNPIERSPRRPSPPHPRLENAALLALVAARDAAAFAQLYDNLAAPMYSLVVRMVGSRADAEDVLQIGFHQIWRCAGDYRVDLGSPFGWIATIMRRKAIDRLRSRLGHFQRIHEAFQSRGEEPENDAGDVHLLARERQEAVRRALFQLNRDERSAIRLSYFDGLTHGEIAQILDAPIGTVKARIRRGLQKLRCAMTGLSGAFAAGGERAD